MNQLHEIGSPERAEAWVRETVASGGRIMGFGHRVYRAYDPRAAALRGVAEAMDQRPEWLDLAIQVEDVVLRVLAELKPGRVLKTNVEYYAAAVLQGVGLTPDLFPATFALARHAGWTAHAIEQVGANKLIRPDMRYTGSGGARPARVGRGPASPSVRASRAGGRPGPARPAGSPSRRGSPRRRRCRPRPGP